MFGALSPFAVASRRLEQIECARSDRKPVKKQHHARTISWRLSIVCFGQNGSTGHVIFEVGNAGDCSLAVQSGEVDLNIGNQVVETIQPGGSSGEKSLIDGESRAAREMARTHAELGQIDAAQLEFMLHNTPNFALNILRVASRRPRKMDRNAAGEVR